MPKTKHRRRSELLMRCIPMLRDYVRQLVGSREPAHDVLQEVILRILSDPAGPDDTAEFATWSRAVARGVAAEGKQLRFDELPWDDEAPDPPDPWGDPERAADNRETLQHAVDHLTDEGVQLLVRRYVYEENAHELARQMAKTPSALRVRLMRLRTAARGAKPG